MNNGNKRGGVVVSSVISPQLKRALERKVIQSHRSNLSDYIRTVLIEKVSE